MIFVLLAFLGGLFIPHFARRFAKFMPASPAEAIFYAFYPCKSLKCKQFKEKFLILRKSYRWRSFMFALAAAVFMVLFVWKSSSFQSVWYLIFVLVALSLAEIDFRLKILPDILVVPLLILGFGFNLYVGNVSMNECFWAALIGYILPIVASLPFVMSKPDAMGGGDVKYLAAIGAWLGVQNLFYAIILSCFLFIIYALIKKTRVGAYGPALSLAALVLLLFM